MAPRNRQFAIQKSVQPHLRYFVVTYDWTPDANGDWDLVLIFHRHPDWSDMFRSISLQTNDVGKPRWYGVKRETYNNRQQDNTDKCLRDVITDCSLLDGGNHYNNWRENNENQLGHLRNSAQNATMTVTDKSLMGTDQLIIQQLTKQNTRNTSRCSAHARLCLVDWWISFLVGSWISWLLGKSEVMRMRF